MRTIMILAAVATLGACSKPAEEPAASEPTAAATDAAAAATDSPVGDYTFVDKDNKQGKLSIAADNTYSVTLPDGTAQKGVFSANGEKGCYDPEGDKDPTVCWTNGKPAADGTWQATNDQGDVVTVTRVSK